MTKDDANQDLNNYRDVEKLVVANQIGRISIHKEETEEDRCVKR